MKIFENLYNKFVATIKKIFICGDSNVIHIRVRDGLTVKVQRSRFLNKEEYIVVTPPEDDKRLRVWSEELDKVFEDIRKRYGNPISMKVEVKDESTKI